MKLTGSIAPIVALSVAFLAAVNGPAIAGQLQKPTKCSQPGQMADWSGYSNGITSGGEAAFVPDRCFSFLHVSEIDVAMDGGPPDGLTFGPGEVAVLNFTWNFEDGSVSTSGPTGYFHDGFLWQQFPNVFWAAQNPPPSNGKRLTSLGYSLTTINSPPLDHVTGILSANGFEYVDE
jgi:hypothetical protein